MKVILTGGNGMMAQNIQAAWRESKQQFDLVTVSRKDADLTDAAETLELFKALGADAIIHAAAKVGGIAANIANPTSFLMDNLAIDSSVFRAAKELGVKRLVYFGSSCMYPRDYRQPLEESDLLAAPLEPTNEGYALAKIVGAKYCAYSNAERHENYKVLIPSNLYGPFDDYSLEHGHLVAATIRKAHEAKLFGKEEIIVWGDGTARREFTYAHDIASWIVDNLSSSEEWPTMMNLGSGVDYSILEYYQTALQVVGYSCRLVTDPTKPAGMQQKLMDSTSAAALGWSPTTSLLDGMHIAYRHYLEHQNA